MDIVSGIVVYILLWWWVFFMTLPFGAKPVDDPEDGHAPSAPEKPRMLIKLAITTGVAVILWGVAWVIINSGFISFRDLARIDSITG